MTTTTQRTRPQRVNFHHNDNDRAVLELSARLLTDRAIARHLGYTTNQVVYRRMIAARAGMAINKREMRDGNGIGRLLLRSEISSSDIERRIRADLMKSGLYR